MRGDNILTTLNELLFFDSKQDSLVLYETFRKAVLEKVPKARIEVKKTQISFFNRRMFAAVSFAPVRKAKNGEICHVIGVLKAIRKQLGKKDGDKIHVVIMQG